MKRTITFLLIFTLLISSFSTVDLDDYFKINKVTFTDTLFGYNQDEATEHEIDISYATISSLFSIFILCETEFCSLDEIVHLTLLNPFSNEKNIPFLFANKQIRPPIF